MSKQHKFQNKMSNKGKLLPYHTYNVRFYIQSRGFLRPEQRDWTPDLHHRTDLHRVSITSFCKDYLLCLNIISYSTLFIYSSFQISAQVHKYEIECNFNINKLEKSLKIYKPGPSIMPWAPTNDSQVELFVGYRKFDLHTITLVNKIFFGEHEILVFFWHY